MIHGEAGAEARSMAARHLESRFAGLISIHKALQQSCLLPTTPGCGSFV